MAVSVRGVESAAKFEPGDDELNYAPGNDSEQRDEQFYSDLAAGGEYVFRAGAALVGHAGEPFDVLVALWGRGEISRVRRFLHYFLGNTRFWRVTITGDMQGTGRLIWYARHRDAEMQVIVCDGWRKTAAPRRMINGFAVVLIERPE